MVDLDGDDEALENSMGEKAKRDIVQFVPFNKYKDDSERLATEVLRELPNQVVEFYTSIEAAPNKPREVHLSQINFDKNYARTGEILDASYLNQRKFFS